MSENTGTDLVAGEPTPRAHAHAMMISERAGLIAYASMADVIEEAKLMAQAGFAIRKHFRGNAGACMAIIRQSNRWGMDPYAVANKTYHVNDQLAHESSLVQAVVTLNAPIKGRIKTEYTGEGPDLRIRVWAKLRDEPDEIVEYTSPRIADIKPKNSPLWVTDPPSQLHYWAVRAWARRHFPEVLLGVLDKEEAEYIDADYREIAPERETTTQKLDRISAPKERKPRGASAAMAAADEVPGVKSRSTDVPHDPETGEVKTEQAKAATAPSSEMPNIPESLDRRPKATAAEPAKEEPKPAPKPEPVKVTSGKPVPDPAADARASEQEMAAAAGALDPDDDPFRDEEDEKEEPPHPVRVALEAFVPSAQKASTEEAMEGLRKTLLKEVKKLDQADPLYKEASAIYMREFNAFKERMAAPPPAKEAAQTSSGGGMTADEENELERLLTNDLDHAPRGIDTNDLLQVRAYVQGLKAAQKGRAIGAVPAVYSDVETEAWKLGHAYRTKNPVTSEE